MTSSNWKYFPRNWPFVRGIHRSPVNSPHGGRWRRALMFYLICPWINGRINNREAGDLRRHRHHYDVIVMIMQKIHMLLSYLWSQFNSNSPENGVIDVPVFIYEYWQISRDQRCHGGRVLLGQPEDTKTTTTQFWSFKSHWDHTTLSPIEFKLPCLKCLCWYTSYFGNTKSQHSTWSY